MPCDLSAKAMPHASIQIRLDSFSSPPSIAATGSDDPATAGPILAVPASATVRDGRVQMLTDLNPSDAHGTDAGAHFSRSLS
jgi:hypothetical protein